MRRRKARDDTPLEQLGTYDPVINKNNEKLIAINFERLRYWIARGATPSKPTAELLGSTTVIVYSVVRRIITVDIRNLRLRIFSKNYNFKQFLLVSQRLKMSELSISFILLAKYSEIQCKN